MIRLRAAIDRSLRHRWAGPVLLVLLAVLFALMLCHLTIDAVLEGGVTCLVLVVVLVRVLVAPPGRITRVAHARGLRRGRGSPRAPAVTALRPSFAHPPSLPLRL